MGNKQPKQTLLDVSMELKMTGRQLERQSMKLEGGEKMEMKKIKDVSFKIYKVNLSATLSILIWRIYHLYLFFFRPLIRIKWRTPRFSQRMLSGTERRLSTFAVSVLRWELLQPSLSLLTALKRSHHRSNVQCPCCRSAWSRWTA